MQRGQKLMPSFCEHNKNVCLSREKNGIKITLILNSFITRFPLCLHATDIVYFYRAASILHDVFIRLLCIHFQSARGMSTVAKRFFFNKALFILFFLYSYIITCARFLCCIILFFLLCRLPQKTASTDHRMCEIAKT